MRWLKRILILLLVVIVVAGVFGFLTIRRSYPQLNGELAVVGLENEVVVHRDQYGIPHIYADTTADLFRAQGFVEAQDRFFQMDFWRHIGSGRLSEMFGDSQVETDKFLRSLGFVDIAETELNSMPKEIRQILEWYSDGVNAYLDSRSGSSLSLEYAILPLQAPGYEPEQWTPVHTLTWAKMMSWDLSGNFRNELARTVLAETLTPEQVDLLYPGYPSDHPVVVPGIIRADDKVDWLALPEGAKGALEAVESGYRLVDNVTGGGFEGIGSNNWAISGDLTESGMPILANDPHLGIRMPSIWYEVGLHCNQLSDLCPFEVVGFGFPGTPGVVIGHNANIAWGVTTEAADTQDLFIEKINPSNPHQYEVDGEWLDMEVRTETIQVAGADPIEYEVRQTRNGPIISGLFGPADDLEEIATNYPDPFAVSLAWKTLEPSTLFESILRINLATNWEDFRSAASLWDIAAQNLVYADIQGNIGYQSTGEIPVRSGWDGRLPVAGWDSDNVWQGTIPFEDMPYVFNPVRGYVFSANQPVLAPGESPLIGTDAAYGYRAARIEAMILATDRHDVDSVRSMQMDSRDGGAAEVVPHLLQVDSQAPGVQVLQGLIENWSLGFEAFQAQHDSAGAAVYAVIWKNLLELTFHDDLPEDHWPEGGSRWFEVVAILLEDPENTFWDNAETATIENSLDILERAMADAHVELVELLGPEIEDWAWGTLHVAEFENQTLGQSGIGPVEWLFNRTAPLRVGGGPSIVNAVGWNPTEGYEVNWVPSMRMVIDLGNLDASTSIHTTGQSGHAFHGNYADMLGLWTDGLQHPMLWSRTQVEAGADNTLALIPG